MSGRKRITALVAIAAAGLSGGCGVGPGRGTDDVRLTVTRDFGSQALLASDAPDVEGADTVMRLLQRNAPVRTRYGGGFVQSIGSVSGGRRDGRPVDWFFFVNGTLAEEGATAIDLHVGDRVWFDHRDWGLTPDVRAVVGSFPEPFVHGREGRRLPTRVECADPGGAACDAVARRFVELGIPAGRSALGRSSADESLRVLVGPWSRVRASEIEANLVDRGPRRSGVYARFDDSGKRLTVLDERGRAKRTLGPGTGLIAAVKAEDREPLWFVTGTDEAGVRAAADLLDEATLADRFALAVNADAPVAVPLIDRAPPTAGGAPR